MKKTIFSFVLICIAIYSCKKNPFDYRSKYFGKYNCTVHETSWIMGQGTVKDTTYSYIIEVKKGGNDNNIVIDGTEIILNEDGSFGYSYGMRGEFETIKKLKYTFIGGGLGGQRSSAVTGEKIK